MLKHDNINDANSIDFLKGTGWHYHGKDENDVPFSFIAPYHVWYMYKEEGYDGQWPEQLPKEIHDLTINYFEGMIEWYKKNPPKYELKPKFAPSENLGEFD
jgi:hypothetical protein